MKATARSQTALQARLLRYIREVEGESPEIVPADTRQSGQRRVSDAEVEM